MKGAAFGIILSLIPLSSMAADCFDMAGRDYKIDPDLLRAISWQESRFKIDAIGRNPVTGYGSGLMQIDSQHFNELSRYGIKPDHLLSDACLNIYTGAYYLAQAFKKWGVFVGCSRGIQCRLQKDPAPGSKTLRVCEEDPLLLHGYQSKQTNFF